MSQSPTQSAYAAALAMLSRRDLSEAQVRERLARKGHVPEAIGGALLRLRAAGVVDDRRVAASAARTEVEVKARGRARVMLRLQSLGIPPDIAQTAADEALEAADEEELLERAIARRLRPPGTRIRDAAHFRRLLQQLIRQGFAPSLAIRALKRRAKHDDLAEEE